VSAPSGTSPDDSRMRQGAVRKFLRELRTGECDFAGALLRARFEPVVADIWVSRALAALPVMCGERGGPKAAAVRLLERVGVDARRRLGAVAASSQQREAIERELERRVRVVPYPTYGFLDWDGTHRG
jgi:hypothetical protein